MPCQPGSGWQPARRHHLSLHFHLPHQFNTFGTIDVARYRPIYFLMRQLITLNAPGCWRHVHQGPATGSVRCRCRALDSKWTMLPSVLPSVCVLVPLSFVHINVYVGHSSQLMGTMACPAATALDVIHDTTK